MRKRRGQVGREGGIEEEWNEGERHTERENKREGE